MTSQTDDEKKAKGAEYGGHSSLSYNSYLKVPDLKNLQICQSNPPHHDEPLFIVIHQTYELWFKLILHEIDEVMKLLADNRVKRATHFLRRIVAIMKVLVNQIHILETMSPQDFLGFRNNLNPASGFQSTQFREIEIACGLKDKRLLEHFKNDEIAFTDLMRRYESHTLQDAYYEVLKKQGFVLPGPYDVDEADPKSVERQETRIQSLRKLYEQSEEYADLNDLAEVLIDIDEQISLWRTNHVTVVERVIGFKRGTGGSEGVGYLRSTLHKRCFADLWKVRSVLELPTIVCGPS
jgi:tryptophan 2,3-dioxygenase